MEIREGIGGFGLLSLFLLLLAYGGILLGFLFLFLCSLLLDVRSKVAVRLGVSVQASDSVSVAHATSYIVETLKVKVDIAE